MIVPQFLRFYTGYTVESVLGENARVFFALVNSMYRIMAQETLNLVKANAIPQMDRADQEKQLSDLNKASKGVSGIVQEIRNIKK